MNEDTNNSLVFTGEQMILGQGKKSSEEEHLARYKFVEPFVKDQIALDVACGVGYGTHMLKTYGANFVYGIDISKEAITYAQNNYSSNGVKFIEGNAISLPLSHSSVDVIVSFETIEHLKDQDRDLYLSELSRVLKKNGTLILSTPNRRITSPGSKKPMNKFHYREYTLNELERILNRHGFTIKMVYGQRVRKTILSVVPIRKCVSLAEKILGRRFDIYDKAHGPDVISFDRNYEPRYYVVVASPIM